MDFLKRLYNAFNRQEIDSTNNFIEFIWESEYTDVQCLWKIYSVFKEFGVIENIKLIKLRRPLSRLVIVEFTTNEEAIAVLLKHQIKIENYEIVVKPCNRAFHSSKISERVKVDDTLFLEPPDQHSPKNILNILNDDCLYEIFKRIHPSKYYIIAEVCVKFNELITETLTKKHEKSVFHISNMQSFTLSEANHYLRYFGSSIYQAEINRCCLKSENRLKIKIMLGMISEHCVNLRHLKIFGFELEKETVNEIIPLFMRIEELTIIKSDYDPIFFPSINCPKLVKFSYNDINTDGRKTQFHLLFNFLSHNSQLTSFWYFGDTKHGCKKLHLPMYRSIFGRFKSLNSLTLINTEHPDPSYPIDEQLFKVSKLVEKLARKKVPIEILKFVRTILDDVAIEYISEMKTIKKFIFLEYKYKYAVHSSSALTRDIIESYIIRLETGLPNIEFLQFQTRRYIDIVFTDEHIIQIEKDLQNISSEIKLNMQEFNGTAFNDKYKLSNIQNTYRQYRRLKAADVSKICCELRLTIRKLPAIDLKMQRYWLTLCYNDEDRHDLRLPLINKWTLRTNGNRFLCLDAIYCQ